MAPVQFKTWYLCCFLLPLAACQHRAVEPENTRSELPPNIIYILADDLGYGDVSCYGQTHFSTPHIDKLAQSGMLFTQHYSGAPVCAPARSVLMTGLHTGHTPVRGNAEVFPEGQEPLPSGAAVLPALLREASYRTGGFGKWGLGYPGSEGAPENQGFDYFFGYNCQRFAHTYWPEHLWRNDQKVPLPENEGFKKRGTYAPQVIQEETLNFVRRNAAQPFFLYYAHLIPHAELQAPTEYLEKYRGKFLPEKTHEGWNPPEPKPKWGYSGQTEGHAAFAAMVEVLDEQVGELIDLLDSLGIRENTLVVFTSDNGPHLEGGADPDYFDSNGPLRGYKRDLYEGGIRVPFIASWPGHIKSGSQSDHISGFQDMLPTFLSLANVTPPSSDGISMLPTLLGQEQENQHSHLYWEFGEQGGRVALRKGKWKAVRYNVISQEGDWELYNLEEDPGETNNLATSQPDTLQALINLVRESHQDSEQFPLPVEAVCVK